MSNPVFVVKSQGTKKVEAFDRSKLQKSILATCLSLRTPEGQAEEIAKKVTDKVESWAKTRQEVTSADIRRIGAEALKKFHSEAAFLYKQQLTVL